MHAHTQVYIHFNKDTNARARAVNKQTYTQKSMYIHFYHKEIRTKTFVDLGKTHTHARL